MTVIVPSPRLTTDQAVAVRDAFVEIYAEAVRSLPERWNGHGGQHISTVRHCHGVLRAAHRGNLLAFLIEASPGKVAALISDIDRHLALPRLAPDVAQNCRVAIEAIHPFRGGDRA